MTTLQPIATTRQQDSNLARIETRLEHIERMLARFEAMAAQAPGLVGMASDIADEWATRDGRVDARLTEVLELLKRVTRPEALQSLQTLVQQLEAVPGLFAMLGDMLDAFAQEAQAGGADLHIATEHLFETFRALVKLLGRPEIGELLRSGVLSSGAVRSMNMAARAFAEAGTHSGERLGLFGAFSKTRDPDVQRALAFLLNTAKTLGRALDTTNPAAAAPRQLTRCWLTALPSRKEKHHV
jgi:hypothetical protein